MRFRQQFGPDKDATSERLAQNGVGGLSILNEIPALKMKKSDFAHPISLPQDLAFE